MTLFDRYVLRRFLSVFTILFVSTFGLFTVIDGFTNVDEFQSAGDGVWQTIERMVRYYGLQSSIFFELVGTILSTLSVMIVIALLVKQREVHPLLAAGIPSYRLAIPLLAGSLLVSGALAANQEWVIPAISHRLQAPRKAQSESAQQVEPIYDSNRVYIDGDKLFLGNRRLVDARFVLPAPEIAHELTTLRADEAVFINGNDQYPRGWLLRGVSPSIDELELTDDGRQIVLPTTEPDVLYVASNATFDQLYNRHVSYKMVSTAELLRRIQSPSIGMISTRGQILHFHNRLTRPVVSLLSVTIVIPLILRRDRPSLIGNMAVCTAVLGVVAGLGQAFHYLGSTNLVAPDLAVWCPIMATAGLGGWLTGTIQT